MSERRLIDATALCQYLSNWQLSCAGNVTGGKDAQLTKAVEEMSELTKALCKLKECKRKYDTPFNRETQEVYSNIEEEIADVFIMLVQLFAIFNPHELVNITKIVWDKLDRLKDNLDKEASKQEDDNAGKE